MGFSILESKKEIKQYDNLYKIGSFNFTILFRYIGLLMGHIVHIMMHFQEIQE